MGEPYAHLAGTEGVRFRPAMYVGGTDFWGLVQYVVSAYRLLINFDATRIELTINDGQLMIDSNAKITADLLSDQPFQKFLKPDPLKNRISYCSDAIIINALSKSLLVSTTEATFYFEQGKPVSAPEATKTVDGVVLKFIPDDEIFTITTIDPGVLKCYLQRMSYLYPDVQFLVTIEGERSKYSSLNGMVDMFTAASAPYQLLHKPIHITGVIDQLEIELVFALHGWIDKIIWSFANGERAAGGGTHEIGLRAAFAAFMRKFSEDDSPRMTPGHLAVLSFKYPKVKHEGCWRGKISNEELEPMIRDLVTQKLSELDDSTLAHMKEMSRFQFADIWFE